MTLINGNCYFMTGSQEVVGSNPIFSNLHNNRIGYLSKYKDFRDKQNLGKMSYSAFATNVYTYTSDLNNGVDWESKWQFLDDTNKKSQDCKDCKSDRKTISKSTFIYIDK